MHASAICSGAGALLGMTIAWACSLGPAGAQAPPAPPAAANPAKPAEPKPAEAEAKVSATEASKDEEAYRRGFLDGFRAGAGAAWRPQAYGRRRWNDRPWYPRYRYGDRSYAPYWYDREPRRGRPWRHDDRYGGAYRDGDYYRDGEDRHRFGGRWSEGWTSYRPSGAGPSNGIAARDKGVD